jgi:hypothetical protein
MLIDKNPELAVIDDVVPDTPCGDPCGARHASRRIDD